MRIGHHHLVALLAVACIANISPCASAQEPLFAEPAGAVEQEVDRLVGVLKSDASTFDKQQASKRLALLGDERCVPAVAELLADEKLSHSSRHVLETIPGPAADEALRDALTKVNGQQLVGVINSIGVRGDKQAVKDLSGLLRHSDDEVARAAATAIGSIGTPQSAQVIASFLKSAKGDRLAALQDAQLRCAERLAERNRVDEARQIYNSLLAGDAARQVRLAAAVGVLRTEPDASAAERFAEYLASDDEVKIEAAVYASHERAGRGVTQALAAAVERAPQYLQVQLLDALRVRGDAEVVPQIAAAYENGSSEVKIAALMALGQIGDRRSVPLLIAAATDFDRQVSAAAVDSLTSLQGDGIDAALLEHLTNSNGPQQRVVAAVLGRRGVADAAPALFALLSSENERVRVAALEALGQTVGEDHFAKLLNVLPTASSDAERAAIVAAVDAAARRMPSPDVVASAVDGAMTKWPEAERPELMKVLGAVGGEAALAIVAKAALEGSPELQDAATRELGQWMTPDAAPHLYEIAAGDHRYKTRALRGYLRIARQLNLSDEERLAMCRKALAIAERPDERELALEVMKRCPSAEAIELASSLLDDEQLRQRAVEAAVFIGERIKDTDPAAAKSAGERALQVAEPGELAERARALTSP